MQLYQAAESWGLHDLIFFIISLQAIFDVTLLKQLIYVRFRHCITQGYVTVTPQIHS